MVVYGRGQLPGDDSGFVLLMDKPAGITSFGVIRRLRPLLRIRKIGHAGTLDPAATGLLICLVGRATRQMEQFMRMPKTYQCRMRLGEVTPSYDADTDVTERSAWQHLTMEDLERIKKRFVGTIQQQPPMYSAVKVRGERLYKKARRGEVVDRPYNTVVVHEWSWGPWEGPEVSFMVRSSKGTYVRSLVHDMGQALGVGAHLRTLRRMQIGSYHVDDAWTLEALAAAVQA